MFWIAAAKLSTARSLSVSCRCSSEKAIIPSMDKQATISTGALAKRSRRSTRLASSTWLPSLIISAAQASAIRSDSSRLTTGSSTTTKRHGWLLCAEGAQPAASKTFKTSSLETDLSWYLRMLRRPRSASCKLDIKEKIRKVGFYVYSLFGSKITFSELPASAVNRKPSCASVSGSLCEIMSLTLISPVANVFSESSMSLGAAP